MLQAAARETLDEQGYALVARALSELEIQRLRCAFDAPDTPHGTQHVRVTPATSHYESWLKLNSHPILLAAAEHVLGSSFEVRDSHGRNPLPGYGQQGLHRDWPERSADSPYEVLTALWLLDDFTQHNGATRVVPGTHRLIQPISKALAQPLAIHREQVVITARAGSLLLLNGHVWHSGTKNQSAGPRRAVQLVVQRRSAR